MCLIKCQSLFRIAINYAVKLLVKILEKSIYLKFVVVNIENVICVRRIRL
jgi:hypothetical protein